LTRRFYIITKRTASRAAGFELTNGAALFRKPDVMMMPPPGRRGFREYPELPLFVADKKRRLHWDLDRVVPYYWLVTAKMKSLMEALDREAFEFLQCRVQFPDGSDGPARWLCDVVRVLDAVDEEKSKLTIRTGQSGNKYYSFLSFANLFFKRDVVGTSRFFRLSYSQDCVICDDEVKAACESADLKGLHFVAQGLPPERPKAFPHWLDGNSHRERGELATAIAAYGEAIRLGRSDAFYPRYFLDRAEAHFAVKDIDTAIADYDEAIKVNPPNGGPQRLNQSKLAMRLSWLAEAYWGRGKALLEKGDRTRAEQDFETARKLGYDRS
jgi:tetratricopeptide (TPR) repeat protein